VPSAPGQAISTPYSSDQRRKVAPDAPFDASMFRSTVSENEVSSSTSDTAVFLENSGYKQRTIDRQNNARKEIRMRPFGMFEFGDENDRKATFTLCPEIMMSGALAHEPHHSTLVSGELEFN
jgi:hypothetical protein